jgi:superfamily II DNA or RNA helicase
VSALTRVRAAIAAAALGQQPSRDHDLHVGEIELRPHQRSAVRRIESAIAEFRGALLADEPGLGKTFVALAVASRYERVLVAAPASLADMWRDASCRAHVRIEFVSLEALSRKPLIGISPDFVIIDEAHHASNPSTARYSMLMSLTATAPTLLLSATPLRNNQREVDALLALFLGADVALLSAPKRARCIVRREATDYHRPQIIGPEWKRLRSSADFGAAISALPPAVLALDSEAATALIAMTLTRAWASSLAAFDRALMRRLQRGLALDDILSSGRMPTRHELQSWIIGDDAVQLAFPWMATHASNDTHEWRVVLALHLDAVRSLRTRVRPLVAKDTARRAALLWSIVRAPRARCTIAFTTFASTAESLYAALRREPGVALLTSRGARTAGGHRRRAEIIEMLGPDAPEPIQDASDTLRLVIATDVLSEGVNLQRADTIVHLDLPWTPAGLEQRVGRAARIGSRHHSIVVLGIAPPPRAMRVLSMDQRLNAKRTAARSALQSADDAEALFERLAEWRSDTAETTGPDTAAARSTRDGFLAVIRTAGATDGTTLIGGTRWRGGYVPSDEPSTLRTLAAAAFDDTNESITVPPRTESHARAAIARFLGRVTALSAAGLETAESSPRRTIAARLDKILSNLPTNDRPIFAKKSAAIRASLSQIAGASFDRALELSARDKQSEAAVWLASLETVIAHHSRGKARTVTADSPAVTALLLLVKAQPPTIAAKETKPAPSRARRSPWS